MRVISYYWIHPDDGMPQIDKTEQSKDSSKEERRRFYVTDKRRKNMKNSNLFKKFAVMVVSAMMVVTSFAMPTFAAPADDTTLVVQGVEKEAAVQAYQIVGQNDDNTWALLDPYGEPVYKDVDGKQVVDYYKVKGFNPEIRYNFTEPSREALDALAVIAKGQTANSDLAFTYDEDSKEWRLAEQSTPGSYLVLATTTKAGVLYNPMLVSINPEGDKVKSPDGNNVVDAKTAVGKRSDIPFEKVVDRRAPHNTGTNADNGNATGDFIDADPQGDDISAINGDFSADSSKDGNKGDTAGSWVVKNGDNDQTVYDDVWFRINTKLPEYADNFFAATPKPSFIVYDTLSKGLTFNAADNGDLALTVKVTKPGKDAVPDDPATTDVDESQPAVPPINEEFLVTDAAKGVTIAKTGVKVGDADKTFSVTFDDKALQAWKGADVEICYSAKLNAQHDVNFDSEENTAELWYTRNPGEAAVKNEERITYHYTFSINAKVDGNAKEINREVVKIGLDEYDEFVFQETETIKEEGWRPLQGVTFDLKKESDDSLVKRVITDENGILTGMDQIDAGEYYLIETSLGPNTEYRLNETKIPVSITCELDSLGRLSKYKIIVNNILVGNYEKDYASNLDTTGTVWFLDENNQRIASLNSDGDVVDVDPENIARHTSEKITIQDNDTETADIINTKVGTLPSTGGIGTVIFTVGGIAIMALALFILFGAKKKEQE